MNDIPYYQKSSKIDKQGLVPVFMIFQHSGTQFEYYTKEKCTADQWDSGKMKFRRSMPGYQEANEHLQTLTDRLRTIYRNTVNSDEPITNELLRSALDGRSGRNKSAIDMIPAFAAYLDSKKQEVKKSTMRSMEVTQSRIKRFADVLYWKRLTVFISNCNHARRYSRFAQSL